MRQPRYSLRKREGRHVRRNAMSTKGDKDRQMAFDHAGVKRAPDYKIEKHPGVAAAPKPKPAPPKAPPSKKR